MLKPGDKAPEFTGTLADGKRISLANILAKHHLVLYFFPKDFTPGCTKEACSFRDHRGEINRLGAEIYGVSLDSADKHAQFAKEYKLNFPLISDADKSIARAYDVQRLGGWLPNKRVTFVIDREGIVRHVTRSELNMDVHIDEAINALKSMG